MQFQTFDEAYVERLRDGDFRTQEHFVAYFSELIQLKLRSRLHSPQAIEDVRQEIFARVFAALRSEGRIRQPERLGAFVNSLCNNVLLEYYRASQRDTSLEDEEDQDFPAKDVDIFGAVAAKQIGEKVREMNFRNATAACYARFSSRNGTKMTFAGTSVSTAITFVCSCTGPSSPLSHCI